MKKSLILPLCLMLAMTSTMTAQEEDCHKIGVSQSSPCFQSTGDSIILYVDYYLCVEQYKIQWLRLNSTTGTWDSVYATGPWETFPSDDPSGLKLIVKLRSGEPSAAYRATVRDIDTHVNPDNDTTKVYYSDTLYVSNCIPITVTPIDVNLDSIKPIQEFIPIEGWKPMPRSYYQQKTSVNASNTTGKKISPADISTKIVVYPNPTSGWVTIQPNRQVSPKAMIKIFDRTGLLVSTQSFSPGKKVDMQLLPPGMYLVQIFDDNRLVNTPIKVVKLEK